jgi:REP element-mobilizing transposase RayT
MPRLLRFIPPGGALVEVTTRTFQGRFLLTPGPALNRIIVGALARASRRHEVKVVAAAFVSNHFHLAVWVEDAEQLTAFMTLFNSKLAREVARLTGWTDKVWSRRYQAIVVSQEEGAQVDRLRYILAHGCKEGLVARLAEWPGVHAAAAILSGTPLEGVLARSDSRVSGADPGQGVLPRGIRRVGDPGL